MTREIAELERATRAHLEMEHATLTRLRAMATATKESIRSAESLLERLAIQAVDDTNGYTGVGQPHPAGENATERL